MPFVSVIIPVYNSCKYLNRCLDSLERQSLSNFEVIIIDDGSDTSFQDMFKNRKLDVKYFRSETNKGTLLARKEGVKHSSGKYILFIDSDDTIELNTIEVLYKTAEKGDYDIVQSSITDIKKGHITKRIFDEKNVYDEKDIYEYIFRNGTIYIWGKLIKKSLFDSIIDLIPDEYIVVQEDTLITFLLTTKAKRMKVLNKPLFLYYRGEGLTTSHTILPIEVFIKYCTSMKAFNYILNYLDKNTTFDRKPLENKYKSMKQVLLRQINNRKNQVERLEYEKELAKVL